MKNIIRILLVVAICVGGFAIYSYNRGLTENTNIGVEENNPLFIHFKNQFSEKKPVKAGYEDVNNDTIPDLLVVYRDDVEDKNFMAVILDFDGEYHITEPVPAPYENVEIQYKNIDDVDEMEFIVSGSRDGNYGYAIFRVTEDLEIRDLFSEDMDDCC